MVSKYHAHHDIRQSVMVPLLCLALTALSCVAAVFVLDDLGLRIACSAGAVASSVLVVGLWLAQEWARKVGGVTCLIAGAGFVFGAVANPEAMHSLLQWFLLFIIPACGVYLLLPRTRTEFVRARELIARTKAAR